MEGIDGFIDDYHLALDRFFNGDPEPTKVLYSHRADATLNNPFGPSAHGWDQVRQAMEDAAVHYRDGRATGFDRVAEFTTAGLTCIVEVEHYAAKVGGADNVSTIDLRVTTVFRPEDGGWRIAHRHADPITAARPAESVISG